jgi:hypothetical protein
MKIVRACAALGVCLATSQIATAGPGVLEKTDKAGIAIPRYERSRIERTVTEKPRIDTRGAGDLLPRPKANSLTLFPHQPTPQRPYRHVRREGYDSTPYRISPSNGYYTNPYRARRGDWYWNDPNPRPSVQRPAGDALVLRTDRRRYSY